MRIWKVGTVGLLLLVGCSPGESTRESPVASSAPGAADTTSTVPATSVPPVNVRYNSVFDMREAVEAGGFECTDWEVRGSNDWSIESADCTRSVVFAIFENASDIADQREIRHELLRIISTVVYEVSGPNWNVGCEDPRQCDELHAALGGEVLTFKLGDD